MQQRHHRLAIIGVQPLFPETRLLKPLLSRVAQQSFGLLADEMKTKIKRFRFPDDAVD